jgi:hypothetical protein
LTLYTSEVLLKVINGKVTWFGFGFASQGSTVGARIEASENALAATEVMPPRGDAAAGLIEHRRVVGSPLINAGNRHNHAE